MKTVIFEGPLKALYPLGIELDAVTPAEAIGLLQNFPGFRPEDGVTHHLTMPDFPSKDSFYQPTDRTELLLTPIEPENTDTFSGSGGKARGYAMIVIGVAMMYFSSGEYGKEIFMAGFGLVLGGIMQLMMPQPPKTTNSNDPKSNYLSANKNTVAVGTPIPLLLGRFKVYGHLLSFNITATNISQAFVAKPTGLGEAAASNGVVSYNFDWSTVNG